ncbi:class II aldolase [Falsiroseomonas bella]|uniref:Class II aldolase n=1 Tax=Falsiroseomonas bella TaxID=2184016 RepID=A0A317FIC3_9PROT|nr:class II aldolase/adducin family protein [Falsiroseomonas bella]PWS38353.1 class II aldolase [Falsiroseomonas bella]
MADTDRKDLVAAARALDAAGHMPQKSGNLSLRTARGFVITPSGLPYAAMTEADLVECAADGAPLSNGRPSSEWRLHAAIFSARADAQAVVHTHSPRATALACARRGIPPLHYMITLAGAVGRAGIPCARHATFGTEALAQECVAALGEGLRATLLANHGVVALGASLAGAVALAREVENLAGQYLDLLAAGLKPVLLSKAELADAAAQLKGYGRPA